MFLTGEFSRIARISKRMLQHYDRIGLFSPEYTDAQTGYRYYSARQLPRLNRILALKDMGLTLEQIQHLVNDNVTLPEIRGMLLMQKVELENQLREGVERIQRVEARLERLDDTYAGKHPEVVVKSVPAQSYLATRRVFADLLAGQMFMQQLLTGLPGKVGRNALGSLMSVMHSPVFELENSDSELGFLLKEVVNAPVTVDEDLVLAVQTLPTVETMATTVQIGTIDLLPASYAALLEWMEVHHYRPVGPQREIYLELPNASSSADLVTEIQFPVEKIALDLNLLTTTVY
jgi:DNA-binding transcriptional MerR regulator